MLLNIDAYEGYRRYGVDSIKGNLWYNLDIGTITVEDFLEVVCDVLESSYLKEFREMESNIRDSLNKEITAAEEKQKAADKAISAMKEALKGV